MSEVGVPCCKVRCMRSCGEENSLCRTCGKFGCLKAKTSLRKKLFTSACIASVVALVLQIVIACGTSTSNNVIKNVAWSTFDVEDTNVTANLYVAARRYVVELDGTTQGISTLSNGTLSEPGTYGMNWDEESCTTRFNGEKYCNKCKDASTGQITSTYTGLLSSLGQIKFDVQRRTYETDYNCQKTFGIITGVVDILMNIITVSSFYKSCVDPTNSNFADVDGELGVGMQCLIVSTIIKFFDTAVHIMIPSPVERTNKRIEDRSVALA